MLFVKPCLVPHVFGYFLENSVYAKLIQKKKGSTVLPAFSLFIIYVNCKCVDVV